MTFSEAKLPEISRPDLTQAISLLEQQAKRMETAWDVDAVQSYKLGAQILKMYLEFGGPLE